MRKIRTSYDRAIVVTEINSESVTEPEHAAGCDLRNILAYHERTGGDWNLLGLPPRRIDPAFGDDVAMDLDLLSAHEQMRSAMEQTAGLRARFMQLPADERAKYGNDMFAWAKAEFEAAIKVPDPKPDPDPELIPDPAVT